MLPTGREPERGASRLLKLQLADVRALVVSSAWAPEHFPHRLVRRLVAEGSEVTLAAVGDRGRAVISDLDVQRLALPEGDRFAVATVVRVGCSVLGSGPTALRDQRRIAERLGGRSRSNRLKSWYALLPFLGRRWDALHLPAEAGTAPYLPLFGVGGPAVVTVERPLPRPGSQRDLDEGSILRSILQEAAVVQCASPALGDQAIGLGADRSRIELVPPFVDTSFFGCARRTRRDGALRLVCTAPFHWSAGHEELLVAFTGLLDTGVEAHLDMVADGADQQRLLFTLQDLGVESNVTVHGDLHRDDVRRLLCAADVFVLASAEDRVWPELLEAIAVGLPAVASDVPSLRAALKAGDDVVLVPPHDPAALGQALATCAPRVVA